MAVFELRVNPQTSFKEQRQTLISVPERASVLVDIHNHTC